MNQIKQLSVNDCITQTHQKLEAVDISYGQGTVDAEQEAIWLVTYVLDIDIQNIDDELETLVSTDNLHKIGTLLEKRIQQHIPLAYLTNEIWFAGLHFYVDERVLIPRSHIAEFIQDGFEPWLDNNKIKNVLDLCTGSACIAVAMAIYYENAEVDASDISNEALEVAQRNIEKHQVQDRVQTIQSNLFQDIPKKKYDLILSNPPYVDAATMANLPEEFKKEPALGLASGGDGLNAVREILGNAANYLQQHGILVCEVGDSAGALMQAFPDLPFLWLETYHGAPTVFLLTQHQLQKF